MKYIILSPAGYRYEFASRVPGTHCLTDRHAVMTQMESSIFTVMERHKRSQDKRQDGTFLIEGMTE